ncbi:MAG: PRD domain-containing protein, partial [Erysipelotrichaceae bacterium]|nr:PRD domain-containing protein [Erysipelotrichaceae bacterium]
SQYKVLSLNYAQEKSIRIEAIDYRSSLQYNDILELIYNKIAYLGNDSGVVVITDSVPLTDIEDNIREKTGIKCKVISPLSYDMIIRCIDELSKSVSLDALSLGTKKIANSDHNKDSEEEFINRLTDDVLSKTLTHINPHKAVDALLVSLNEICDELKISKSRDVIVKYLSHGVHMLERVIKHQPLNYYQLNKFSAENHNLMDIIAKSLSSAESIFDLSVPTCEIAYLAEIFLEGVE